MAFVGALDREFGFGRVDVGPHQCHPTPAHIIDEHRQLFRLVHIEAHRCSVEFVRVMRLEPGSLVRQQRVSGGVAFVEAIACELVDQVEQLVGFDFVDIVVRLATIDEPLALRIHFSLYLLTHRAAQQVGITQRIAGEHLRGLHHLFLIDDDAVSLGQNAFEFGVRVLDRLQPILAAAEQRNIVHWPRAVQRADGDDVAEVARLYAR